MGVFGWKRVAGLAGLFVLVSVLAGCVDDGGAPLPGADAAGEGEAPKASGGDDPDGNVTLPPPHLSPLRYENCTFHGLALNAPTEFFAGSLPPGFEFVSADPLGLTARLEMVVIECATSRFRAEERGGVTEFRLHLDVVPPSEHENPDAVRHFVLLAGVHSDPDVVSLYRDWNVTESANGSASTSTVDLAAARAGSAVVQDFWVGLDLRTLVETAEPQCQEEIVFRSYGLVDGDVANYVDIDLDAACFGIGAGKAIIQAGPPSEPTDAAVLLAFHALTTGTGFQTLEPTGGVTQSYTALAG